MSKHQGIPPDGFLAEPWPALKRKIREGERGRMFDFCEKMNRYGMKLACELRARRSVPAEAYGLLFCSGLIIGGVVNGMTAKVRWHLKQCGYSEAACDEFVQDFKHSGFSIDQLSGRWLLMKAKRS